MEPRRQFKLQNEDEQFLNDYGLPWEALKDGSLWVLINGFETNPGYNHKAVICAIRIESGYPTSALDMVYFYPALARLDSKPIGRTESKQTIDGKEFQRWSRHRTGKNPWKPGEDNLESHIQLIEDWLEREFEK